ncbi:MAG: hypothetical protein V4690_04305 [Patescibacteria group bacterium]
MKNKIFLSFLFLLVPAYALAADFSLSGSTFKGIVMEVIEIINILIPILVSLAIVFFFWGMSKFILHSDSADGIKNGRNYMLWGLLALFVLFTFRVIIGLVSSDLEIGDKNPNPNSILLPTGPR